jgi:hypothetical protein
MTEKSRGTKLVSEFILAALVLSFDAVLVASALYLVTKLLDWSRNRALPGAHNRIFHIAGMSW